MLLLVISARARSEAVRLLRSPIVFALAATLLAMWLSLGPIPKAGDSLVSGLGLYNVLYDYVPGFNGVRAPARYAMIAGLFLAVVSGYGAARFSKLRSAVVLVPLTAILILIEGAAIPMEINRTWGGNEATPPARVFTYADAPPVYHRVATLPAGTAITEFPFGDPAWEIRYTYYAASHWKPITNGYSGNFPAKYSERLVRLRNLTKDPEAAWRSLKESGSTHVVVHRNAFANSADADTVENWLKAHGAEEIERFNDGDILLKHMRPDPLAFLGNELEAMKQQGLYRKLRVLDGKPEAHTTYDHKSVVNLSSNNYLGLTTHPKLKQAALEAVEKFGVGSGAVRTISGTMEMHMELERRLATFKHVESVVVFQSGFAANAGTVAAVLTKDDVIISDELNHASIIDGCRLSKAPIKVFPHKDVDAARKIMKELPAAQKKILITDGVFSMDGDLGRVPELCALAEEFGAIMMVDDAHASGVFGQHGSGTVDHFGCHGRVDIQVGTLSKAIGVLGGYVAGSRNLIEFLYHRARPFLFSTSHPPAVTAACLAALDILETEPEWLDRLWDNTRFFKAGLETLGFNTGMSESPITPVIVGEAATAAKMSDLLFAKGVFAQSIGFPTVARDKAQAAHHRGGDAHEGRPAVRPGQLCRRGPGTRSDLRT